MYAAARISTANRLRNRLRTSTALATAPNLTSLAVQADMWVGRLP